MLRCTSRYRNRHHAVSVLLLVFTACHHAAEGPADGPSPDTAPLSEAGALRGDPYVLTRSELENVRVRRFEEFLVARFPSVRVSKRGSEYIVRIRGAGNFVGGGDPLFIVDGMPTPTASLAHLNPADVARIEVIKDHRTAFYGVRGAFGVIVVTTVRP